MPQASPGKVLTDSAQISPGIIVNSDVNASAAIDYSKLNLALGIVNADVSASAGIVDTKLATISTAGKVSGAALTSLTNIPAGAGVIPLANLPNTDSKCRMSSMYENIARHASATTGTATVTIGSYGALLSLSAVATSGAQIKTLLEKIAGDFAVGSPVFSMRISEATRGTDTSGFFGIGDFANGGGALNYATTKHIGFKIERTASGALTIKATQSDGTTETASAALITTPPANFDAELIFVVNGATSISYYTRLDGGALSAVTNLTTNIPATLGGVAQAMITNAGIATNPEYYVQSFSYAR